MNVSVVADDTGSAIRYESLSGRRPASQHERLSGRGGLWNSNSPYANTFICLSSSKTFKADNSQLNNYYRHTHYISSVDTLTLSSNIM